MQPLTRNWKSPLRNSSSRKLLHQNLRSREDLHTTVQFVKPESAWTNPSAKMETAASLLKTRNSYSTRTFRNLFLKTGYLRSANESLFPRYLGKQCCRDMLAHMLEGVPPFMTRVKRPRITAFRVKNADTDFRKVTIPSHIQEARVCEICECVRWSYAHDGLVPQLFAKL